jgi:tRNA(Leu) C34 or U34 (ribose-2'-O)-methylase TrmL
MINGRAVGLLRGSGTRMALWFYAMLRVLRLERVLLATIHQAKFVDLPKNARVNAAIFNIQNRNFFKALFAILSAVIHALVALRACDMNEPMMDKIYYLTHQTTEALTKSRSVLNDTALFGEFEMSVDESDLDEEEQEVFGTTSQMAKIQVVALNLFLVLI